MNAIWESPAADAQFRLLRLVAGRHGVVSSAHLHAAGIDAVLRATWISTGRLTPLGVRSFALPASAPGWRRSLAAAVFETRGVVSGRAAARLHGVPGFRHDDIELLVDRPCVVPGAVLVVAPTHLRAGEVVAIDGIEVVTVSRLLHDAAHFHFTATEHARLTKFLATSRGRATA